MGVHWRLTGRGGEGRGGAFEGEGVVTRIFHCYGLGGGGSVKTWEVVESIGDAFVLIN